MKNHEEIARSWARAWVEASPQEFAAQYTDDGMYIDHAFRLAKSGRDAIDQHAAIWHQSMDDFDMQPREIHATENGAIMNFVCTGRFTRDLASLPGDPSPWTRLVATGEPFVFHGVAFHTIDETGKIVVTEEYYSTTFAEVGGQETYAPITAWHR